MRIKNRELTVENIIRYVNDVAGVRIICTFTSDIYRIADAIAKQSDVTVLRVKDYIANPKPNGYRSLHLIVRVEGRYYAEFQLRTISMDTWAALEHHMKYKKKVSDNTGLLVNELKRCADELASTDISMQTLRDMIRAEQSV